FYPFAEAAHHARGMVYVPALDAPSVHTEAYGDVDAVEAVVTLDEHTREGLLLVVNRDAEAAHTLSVDLSGLPQADAADMR
ncbi:alpha-L-arabinofuranosidase, partial [Faecalicatena contorta]|nr:alpha-L-arabinofuranosidase [Faecalicatena contorta]